MGDALPRNGILKQFFGVYGPLLPVVVGLACARAGIVVSTSGSYRGTDEGVFTDGVMVVVFAAFLVAAAVLFKTRFVCKKRLINAIAHAAVAIQFLGVFAMGALRLMGACTFPSRFTLSVFVAAAGMAAIAYWLRRARGASTATAAVLVFSAILISEIPVFLTVFLPDGVRCLVVSPLVAAQFFCIAWARRKELPADIPAPTRADDYFAFMGYGATNRRFLAASVVGIAVVSLIIGFLRGFPDGNPIPFCPAARVASFVVTEVVCVWFIASALRQRSRTMTVGIWIVMELLAASTLVLYTAFPGHLDIGAVSATLLNTLMTAFVWYIVLAFMSSGWRDPFYYAIVIWSAWICARAAGRFVFLGVMPMGDSHFTGTVVSLMLLVATQVVFLKLMGVAEFAFASRRASGNAACADEGGISRAGALGATPASEPSALERLLGLDEASAVVDVQRAAMRHSAEGMGEQFLLSEREVEVLALYASGMTQKRVAEELHISQTTAHTHIGRIYAKTGLHSRQEILDYMRRYSD